MADEEGQGSVANGADSGDEGILKPEGEKPEGEKPEGEKPEGILKPEGEKPEGEKPEGEKPEVKAPEQYANFTLPEGITWDAEFGAEAKTVFKDYNLTQEQAQGLVDLQTKALGRAEAAHDTAFAKMSENWRKEVKEDKNLGGINYEETVSLARAGMAEFAPDGVAEALVATGFENHPGFVRLFRRLGLMVTEGTITTGARRDGRSDDMAQRLYPDQKN